MQAFKHTQWLPIIFQKDGFIEKLIKIGGKLIFILAPIFDFRFFRLC
jgi:hypothetical protein